MAKIIFMSVPGHGHVNPTLAVVQELVNRGHQVIYYNTEEFRQKLERNGAGFRPYPAEATDDINFTILAENIIRVTVMLLERTPLLVPFTMDVLEREQPDLVIFDQLCLWGMIASKLTGIPSVSSISTLVLKDADIDFNVRDIISYIRHGLPLIPKILRSRRKLNRMYADVMPKKLFPLVGDRSIVYSAYPFQPETDFIDETFRLVGPSINPSARSETFPFERLHDGLKVYISLGTVHTTQVDFYQQVLKASGNSLAQFILSTGSQSNIDKLGPIPGNFIVQPAVPQLEVLQRVDLFITHGGMNSVNEGLYYGVPLLVIPQQFEQYANGLRVVAANAGMMIGNKPPYGRVTVDALRDATEAMLNNLAFYRENVQTIGEAFRAAGGYIQAVEEIEVLLKQPVRG